MRMAGKVVSNPRLQASLSRVTGLISSAQNLIKAPAVGRLTSLATGSLGRLLSSRRVTTGSGLSLANVFSSVTSFVSGRAAMVTALKASSPQREFWYHVCIHFAAACLHPSFYLLCISKLFTYRRRVHYIFQICLHFLPNIWHVVRIHTSHTLMSNFDERLKYKMLILVWSMSDD